MMFRLIVRQPRLMKAVVKAIKGFVSNGKFECSAAGISLQAMNSSKVAAVVLVVPSEFFEFYHCDQDMSLGINLDELAEFLLLASDGDSVFIKAEDGDRTVGFGLERPSGDMIERQMNLMIDIDGQNLNFQEELEYQATVKMPASEFDRVCKYLSTFSFADNVEISVETGEVKFCTRDDFGTPTISFRQNTAAVKEEEATIIEMGNPALKVEQSFELRYLKAFTQATPLAAQVTIRMSPHCPILVDYKIMDTVGRHLRFFLSPKVEKEADQAAKSS